MSRNIDSVNIKDFSTHDIEVYVREQCDIMEEAATHVEMLKLSMRLLLKNIMIYRLWKKLPHRYVIKY